MTAQYSKSIRTPPESLTPSDPMPLDSRPWVRSKMAGSSVDPPFLPAKITGLVNQAALAVWLQRND